MPELPEVETTRRGIEPHLRGLHHIDASMPHARGTIHTVYQLEGSAWKATVTLPQGLDGTLQWGARKIPLHSGTQELQLSATSSPE